jgi:Retrotransposon gag protein
VQAYKASELCAVTSRLRAMVQVSAPPAVSVPVDHPGSHQAVSQGADSPGAAVPVLRLPPTSLGSVAGSVLGSVPAVARSSPPLPAKFTGVTSDSLTVFDWLYHMEVYLTLSQAPHPVLLASQNLSGLASEWWLTPGRHIPDILSDWDVFRTALLGRFTSPADSHEARRRLQTERQTAGRSVNDFLTELNRLKSRVLVGDPITPSELAGHFWRGLSDTLRPFLIPLVGADVLNDIALLSKAAQQAELTLKSQGHAVGTKGTGPSGSVPSGSAATWAAGPLW